MSVIRKLRSIQEKNQSMICLGLDLDPKRMPAEYGKTVKGMFDFTLRMIDATSDCVCAYKPNLAFYESLGHEGISLLDSIVRRIPEDIPIILDAKRGDIGNTAAHYAQALFGRLNADWVTVNPYMGYDSIRPFLEYDEKGVFVLCLTSNPGHKDFQMLKVDGRPLFELVAEKVNYWNKDQNFGLVVGATAPEQLKLIRNLAGEMPLLIPGVGAQGGSLEKAAVDGTANFHKLAMINVSRSVLYASRDNDFADKARAELQKLNEAVNVLRGDKRQSPAPPPPQEAVVDSPDREQSDQGQGSSESDQQQERNRSQQPYGQNQQRDRYQNNRYRDRDRGRDRRGGNSYNQRRGNDRYDRGGQGDRSGQEQQNQEHKEHQEHQGQQSHSSEQPIQPQSQAPAPPTQPQNQPGQDEPPRNE